MVVDDGSPDAGRCQLSIRAISCPFHHNRSTKVASTDLPATSDASDDGYESRIQHIHTCVAKVEEGVVRGERKRETREGEFVHK